jgi:hypothetical protein
MKTHKIFIEDAQGKHCAKVVLRATDATVEIDSIPGMKFAVAYGERESANILLPSDKRKKPVMQVDLSNFSGVRDAVDAALWQSWQLAGKHSRASL